MTIIADNFLIISGIVSLFAGCASVFVLVMGLKNSKKIKSLRSST